MNAMNYVNITARLAYYDAMKATAPARVKTSSVADKLKKFLKKTPKRRTALVVVENLDA